MALIALCGARALRGAWDEARDATERLEAPGELFAQPGPDLRFMAALMRLRLGALSGCPAPASAEQLENYLKVLEASGLDLGTLSGFCSCLEVGAFLGRPDLGARGGAAIRRAVGEELVFTQGCEFLLPRVLGLGAALRDDWGEAEAHFERASRIAREIGAAPELARTHLDLAAMLVRRGAQGDRERAARGVEEAAASIRAIGLRGLERRAAELARALGLPEDASAPAPADPERLGEGERQLLECVARGRSDAEICDHLLVGPATLAGSLRALFEKLGVESRVEATAWAFERGIGLPSGAEERLRGVGRPRVRAHLPRAGLRAGQPVAIFVSDIESSTALIQRLGDARARELVHAHNRIARTCLREHAGFEIQHTGDGFIFSFASAPAAVRCAVAFQRALERDRGEQGTGLRVRIGIHAGTSLPEEGRLFGLAMNTTARICSRCPTNEIVASEAARAACGGLPLRFEALGPAVLKGIEDPVLLHRVLWREATD